MAETTTINVVNTDTNLEVVDRFNLLAQEALGADSPYIRAKETLEEMFKGSTLKDREKSEIVANLVSNMAGTITTAAMQSALQWEVQQKELSLKKEQMEYELAILQNNIQKSASDAGTADANKHATQARIIREYGKPTIVDGDVNTLADDGLMLEQTKKIAQDTANALKMNTQIDVQTDEVRARTHQLVADTYVNHGMFTNYTISDDGISGTTKASSHTTLSDMQKYTAYEQIKGYSYNARSNVVTASASMLGTLAATEVADADVIENVTNKWIASVDYLNTTATIPTITL